MHWINLRLTRYSKTRVRLLSVWMMSCNVTILACFRSFNNDTGERDKQRDREIRVRQTERKND